jgi:hypothetical protein
MPVGIFLVLNDFLCTEIQSITTAVAVNVTETPNHFALILRRINFTWLSVLETTTTTRNFWQNDY